MFSSLLSLIRDANDYSLEQLNNIVTESRAIIGRRVAAWNLLDVDDLVTFSEQSSHTNEVGSNYPHLLIARLCHCINQRTPLWNPPVI